MAARKKKPVRKKAVQMKKKTVRRPHRRTNDPSRRGIREERKPNGVREPGAIVVGPKELATHLDVTTVTLMRLLDNGNILKVGKGEYDLNASRMLYIRNLRRRAVGSGNRGKGGGPNSNVPQTSRARYDEAKAQQIEMQVRRERGELVSVPALSLFEATKNKALQVKLRSLPRKIRRNFPKVPENIIRWMAASIDKALEELAHVELPSDLDNDTDAAA